MSVDNRKRGRTRETLGTIYLLCFDEPYPAGARPRHYLGWAEDLDARLAHHRRGRGSALLAACLEKGIGFTLVKTWVGDFAEERRLKSRGPARLCPNPECRERWLESQRQRKARARAPQRPGWDEATEAWAREAVNRALGLALDPDHAPKIWDRGWIFHNRWTYDPASGRWHVDLNQESKDMRLGEVPEDAWICEAHPDLPFPHDDCAGPGMLTDEWAERLGEVR